jgi:transposase-like protein
MIDRGWLAERLTRGDSYAAIARELGCSASRVADWARRHGLQSAHAKRHAARGGIDEAVLRQMVAEHRSVREIARALDRSPTTVRHWLVRYDIESSMARRRNEGALARAAGADEAILLCPVHGSVRHIRRDDGYRCTTCRSGAVTARRRRVKRILLAEAGGACALCGYDRCVAALHFHHVNPASKSFALAAAGVTRSLAAARAEARKCVVLCANCHAEVESGLAELPLRSDLSAEAGDAVPDPG